MAAKRFPASHRLPPYGKCAKCKRPSPIICSTELVCQTCQDAALRDRVEKKLEQARRRIERAKNATKKVERKTRVKKIR